MDDTICAIATSQGMGAISIIRISGKETLDIVSKIFQGKNLKSVKSHTIHYGYIINKDEKIDEVLVSVMLAPKTYTTEDVVEINTHGSLSVINRILELLLENGCRMAEPGEFTKRAFLNGRIDLTQADSVNDLINSKTDAARKLAMNNLGGLLSQEIKNIRKILLDVEANIEVNIDYPEYNDINVVTEKELMPKLKEVEERIQKLLDSHRNGKLINEGINVAIVGKPNVGKSSILNSFLDEEKAIVTNIAGTTRDIVEGVITLNDFLLKFIDTAGIRDTNDVVEKIGVEKSKKVLKDADLVIIVLNNNEKITKEEQELILAVPEEKRIIFVNKSDLDSKITLEKDYILGNTLSIKGIEPLKKAIIEKMNLNNILHKEMTYITNVRQTDLLKKAFSVIQTAIDNLKKQMPIDIVEIDITSARNYLGLITGEVYEDELLDTLFSNFCIGK